jgi:hypothetical protein
LMYWDVVHDRGGITGCLVIASEILESGRIDWATNERSP